MSDDKNPQEKPTRPPFRLTKQRKEELLRLLKDELLKDKEFISKIWKQMWLWLLAAGAVYGVTVYLIAKGAHNRVIQQIDRTELVLSNRIFTSSTEISNLILRTFESSNITLIVRSVAAERASNILETQVAPAVAKLTNEIAAFSQRIEGQQGKIDELNASLLKAHETESNLVTLIDSANRALKELNENAEFITTVVRADHDDREAFDKLRQWRAQPNTPFRDATWGVFSAIQTELFKPTTAWAIVPWERLAPLTNQVTWKIEEINSVWQQLIPPQAFDYVGFVWGHTNITKEQKLSFLRSVYLKDSRNSIRAADRAAELVAEELKAKYNPPMVFEPVETAWRTFIATNRLSSVSTNETTNTVYELFLASDTNRVRVIRDWNDVKLLSFKMEFVPKDGEIEANFMDYSTHAIGTMKYSSPMYKNVCLAYFHMSINDLKFELKYEKDPTVPVIQRIDVTTNEMIFDETKRISIPPP